MTVRRSNRRTKLAGFVPLEDRAVPATFTATINPATDNPGAVAELVSIFNAANTNGDLDDTVNLFPGGRYVFNDADPTDPGRFDGGTALPVLSSARATGGTIIPNTGGQLTSAADVSLTVNGNGATFVRPAGAPSFRFLRAEGGVAAQQVLTPVPPTVTRSVSSTGEIVTTTTDNPPVISTVLFRRIATLNVNNLTMTGGNVYDYRGLDLVTQTKIGQLRGGAVRGDYASINLTDVVLDSNTATEGGGAVYVGFVGDATTFSGNTPVQVLNTFTRTTFTNNYAGAEGGAVALNNADPSPAKFVDSLTAEFVSSTVTGNLSLTGAGGVNGLTATAIFTGTTVTGNRGDSGGIVASSVELSKSLLQGNTATGAGTGAVTATTQMLVIDQSTITSNTSGVSGAVVGQASGLAVEVTNSTIHNNKGGNSTIQATQGEVVLAFATVTNNTSAGGDTGGVSVPNNILTISQSVISGNRAPNLQSQFSDLQSPLLRNQGNNFVGIAPANFPTTTTDIVGRVGAEADPRLGPLADNGGPTPTRLPAAGSPLINAVGSVEATRLGVDQRGFPRPTAGADIGAAEVQANDVLPTAAALPASVVAPPTATSPLTPPPPVVPSAAVAIAPGPVAPSAAAGNLPPPGFLVSTGSTANAEATAVPLPPNAAYLVRPDGTTLTVTPFAASVPGGLRVASGDFNGDGNPDLVVGTGPGAANRIRVFDGVNGTQLAELTPFEAGFTGGVFLAVGDLTGDGVPELVVSPDSGGGGRVIVFGTAQATSTTGGTTTTTAAATGLTFTVVANFFGIDDANFRGGARVAVGDVNADGKADLIVAAGTGGGPRVAIFDGATVGGGLTPVRLVPDFFVFEQSLRNGVYIAAGNVNGATDQNADLVVGGGPGGAPRVQVLSGLDLLAGNQTPLANFFAGPADDRGGVPVGVTDYDGDLNADVTTGAGSTPTARVFLGKTLLAPPAAGITADATLDPLGGYNGGVFVG